jgi:hypothetical protein
VRGLIDVPCVPCFRYPTQVEALTGARVTAAAAGAQHTLFLTADGAVHTCGKATRSRLGHGDKTRRVVPAAVPCLPPQALLHPAPPSPTAAAGAGVGAGPGGGGSGSGGVTKSGGGGGSLLFARHGSTGATVVPPGPPRNGDPTARALFRFLSSHSGV